MSKKKLPSPQEEHEEKVEQTTNIITAEDLIEQAVYGLRQKLPSNQIKPMKT